MPATVEMPAGTGTEAATSQPPDAANVVAQGAQDAPKKARLKKTTTARKNAPKATGKASKKATCKDDKGATILALISRHQGASLAELMQAVSWQNHSVRGFISTAGKKAGVKVESFRDEAGLRIYRRTK